MTADHGAGYDSSTQTVTLHYTISGVNMLYVIIGAILIAVGIALSVVSVRMRKKDKGSPTQQPTTAAAAEVRMFDGKQKLR